MTARDKILAAVKNSQPSLQALPAMENFAPIQYADVVEQFKNVLEAIGGKVVMINSLNDINDFIVQHFDTDKIIITTIEDLPVIKKLDASVDAHLLANIELAILPSLFAVAENGAVWLTEKEMKIRALPFICQQLAVVVNKKDIINNMQDAYDIISQNEYAFADFIAGPSKTADIEQSLVLGAHGPGNMIVFIME
ncbi:MAG: LUD domain-containing protein [Ginsengibacter sp.]